MFEYSKENIKLSDRQLKQMKPAFESKKGTTLIMTLKMLFGDDLSHELSLKGRQKAKLINSFNNNASTDSKLSKVHISKIIQSGVFLGSLLNKVAGQLMKVAISWAKNILAPLGIIGILAAASAMDAGIQKKTHGFKTTNLIIWNKE